jgi:hypothetical protein
MSNNQQQPRLVERALIWRRLQGCGRVELTPAAVKPRER